MIHAAGSREERVLKQTIRIIDYAPEHERAAARLMAELQDVERSLSPDRTRGDEIAQEHFAYLRALCEAHSGQVYLALCGDEVVGFAVVFLESEDEDDEHLLPEFRCHGWLSDLYVKPSHRGGGVATQLVERARRHCSDLGVRRLKLSTLSGNLGARRFYERAGFGEYEVVYAVDT